MRKGLRVTYMSLLATVLSLTGCSVSRVTVRLVQGVPTLDVRFESSQERQKGKDHENKDNQARV